MRKLLLMSFVLCAIACTKNKDGDFNKAINLNNELVILALDVSQSFKLPNVKPDYLKAMCNSLEKRAGNSTVIIYPLGNPSLNPKTITCDIKGYGRVKKGMTLSQKKQAVLRKKKMAKANEEVINKFIADYKQQIYTKKRTAHTDIRSFNKWLYILTQEDQFKQFQKTLFLFSDGVNSIAGKDEFFPLEKEIEGLTIYTCGLSLNSRPFKQSYKELTSYKSFFSNYKMSE